MTGTNKTLLIQGLVRGAANPGADGKQITGTLQFFPVYSGGWRQIKQRRVNTRYCFEHGNKSRSFGRAGAGFPCAGPSWELGGVTGPSGSFPASGMPQEDGDCHLPARGDAAALMGAAWPGFQSHESTHIPPSVLWEAPVHSPIFVLRFCCCFFFSHQLRSWRMLCRQREDMVPGGDTDSMKWSSGKALKCEHPSGHSRMRLLLMGWGFGIRDSP